MTNGAPDQPADDRVAQPAERKAPTSRTEAFSDGVFAIAITLLALDFAHPASADDLGGQLQRLWPTLVAYVISFLLIGLVWANHHDLFEHIATGDRTLQFLNVLLLMDVAVLPYPTSVLAVSLRDGANLRTAVVLYGVVLTVGGVFFNAVSYWARRTGALLDTGEWRHGRYLLGPVLYAVGTLVGLAVPVAGLVCFAALILVYWLPLTTMTGSRRKASR